MEFGGTFLSLQVGINLVKKNQLLEVQCFSFLHLIVREAYLCFYLAPLNQIQHTSSLAVREGVTQTGSNQSCVVWDQLHMCCGCAVWPAFGRENLAYMCCFQETGLYEYKVFGVLATCTAELCADVYMDLAYRKHWDGYVKGKKK